MKVTQKPRGPCPCGSHMAYARCCWLYHCGEPAPDAERLMRSRYSAYVLKLEDYLLATWHLRMRPPKLDLETKPTRWLRLTIIRHAVVDEANAVVEFAALYKEGGRAHEFREVSRFVREDGRWFYVDGDVKSDA